MTPVEHRAAARIAWRYARKARARTALILFLIALPIAALVATGIMINTVIANAQDHLTRNMGSADLLLVDAPLHSTPASIGKVLPPGATIDRIRGLTTYKVAGGTLLTLNVSENSVPSDRPPSASWYQLTSGRMPHAAGEAVLAPDVARKMSVRIGDRFELDGLKHPLTLVGLAWYRFSLSDTGVLVGPSSLDGESTEGFSTYFVQLPPHARLDSAEQALSRAHVGYQDRATVLQANKGDQRRLTGLSLAAAVVALFGTGMIVVTAFGVGARRQLRAHGLVEATGGEPRHVRAIVLWGGTLLGLIGSVIGILTAVAAAFILRPHVNGIANRIVESVRIPWMAIAGGIALGTLAATIAAMAPAKQAAQISAVDALAGRTPHPRAPGRLARRGGIGVLIGCVFTVIATLTREWTLLAIALIVTLTGFLFAIPLLVTFVGRWSAHLPAIPRLAARQTARYGRRTGAAVAAATLALTTPIALSTLILSHDARDNRQAVISNDQMLLSSYRSGQTEVSSNLIGSARAALPGSLVAPIHFAVASLPINRSDPAAIPENPPVSVSGPPPSPNPGSSGAYAISGGLLGVGDPVLLRAVHAEAGIQFLKGDRLIAAGLPTDGGVLHLEMLVIPGISVTEPGPGGSVTTYPAPGSTPKTMDVAAVSVPGGTGLGDQVPRYFIPAHMLKKLGLSSSPATQAVLRAPHTLTNLEIQNVKHAVSLFPGGYAQSQRDYVVDSTPLRLAMTGGAMALALIIVAVAVALVGAESRREQAILSAVGAAPRVRRRMVGANAFLMTALAGVLAVPAGLVPMALILMSERPSQPVPVSWAIVAMVAVGAPLIAGLVAALVSRQPKSRAMLQPNW